jgi:hypothetical protein
VRWPTPPRTLHALYASTTRGKVEQPRGLAERNQSFVDMSLGYESPAFGISLPPPPTPTRQGFAVYDRLVVRVIKGALWPTFPACCLMRVLFRAGRTAAA